jgi:hypothetical protein
MATVPFQLTAGDDGIVDDDELERAGSSNPWEEASSIVDFLVRVGSDVELDVDTDGSDELDAYRTWRGLVPPDDRGDT